MTTHLIDAPPHRVAALVDQVDEALDELAGASFYAMAPAAKRETLVKLARVEAKTAGLRLRLLADAEATGACTTTGAATAAGWMASQTRQNRVEARSDLKLAQRLDTLPALGTALSTGAANMAQARAILRSLDRLPTSGEFAVTPEQRQQAETHLVGLCADYDAIAITALGRKLYEVIAPEAAEAYEGKLLEAEEAKAARKTVLEMWTDHQGLCHGRFRLPARFGQMLKKATWSLTNPVRHESTHGSPIDPDLPQPVRQGVAFTQILESLQAHWLPTSGGVGATVVVTMTKDQLLADLDAAGVCTLDTGDTITAAEARRMACSAGIIPVVLGGNSVILDAGTKTRFHTEPMRIAMGLRDTHCTAEHCDVPASMCHAHHDLPFARGGSTSVTNGRLLCGHHHRRIHDPAFTHQKLPDGGVRFHRRT